MDILKTDRLLLRNVKPEDAAVMHHYRNDPRCSRFQRGQTTDLPGIEGLICGHQRDILGTENNCLLALEKIATGEMVGEVVVMPCEGTFSFGYTISPDYHRCGYAFEALEHLQNTLHRKYPQWDFVCFVDPANTASRCLLAKLGYTDMGYLRHRDSQVYGKWLREHSVAEISAAVHRGIQFDAGE